jgi:hypothetical protein
MNVAPSRRAVLSAVAAAPLSGVANIIPAIAADASPDFPALASQLAAAAMARRLALLASRSARKALARWGERNPRPVFSGDGTDLLAWLDRYRAAIDGSGATARHADHEAACAAHAGLAAVAAALAPHSMADLRALARLIPYDCDGVIRAAVLAHVEAGAFA